MLRYDEYKQQFRLYGECFKCGEHESFVTGYRNEKIPPTSFEIEVSEEWTSDANNPMKSNAILLSTPKRLVFSNVEWKSYKCTVQTTSACSGVSEFTATCEMFDCVEECDEPIYAGVNS